MRSRVLSMLAGLAAAVGLRSAAMPAAPPTREVVPGVRRSRMNAIARSVAAQRSTITTGSGRGAPSGMNGARECARRVRQMARGAVLNWYPGQVRANWRG